MQLISIQLNIERRPQQQASYHRLRDFSLKRNRKKSFKMWVVTCVKRKKLIERSIVQNYNSKTFHWQNKKKLETRRKNVKRKTMKNKTHEKPRKTGKRVVKLLHTHENEIVLRPISHYFKKITPPNHLLFHPQFLLKRDQNH